MAKLEWTQPNMREHIYIAEAEDGHYIVRNVGPARWEAVFNGDPITENESMSRVEAMTLCDAHANPQSVPLELNEYLLVKSLHECGGSRGIGVVMTGDVIPGRSSGQVLTIVYSMARRGIVRINNDQIELTEVGKMSYDNFIPRDPRLTRAGRLRKNQSVSKFGPRPTDVGPPPTVVEFLQVRLSNAQSSLAYAIVSRRVHPYSPKALMYVKKAEDKVQEVRDALVRAMEAERVAEEMGLPVPMQK